jgi:hypothetical protein
MKKSSLVLFLRSSLALLIVLIAAHTQAHAAYTVSAPEIDPAMATGGLALLGGMILVVRGRRRK